MTRRSRRVGRLWLLIPALAFVAALAIFYPATIGIKDESVYLTQSYILRAGTVFADVAHLSVIFDSFHAGHIAPVYPPGVAAFLLPATLISWHATFAVSAAWQLVGFLLFVVLLGRLGIRRGWAVLYLFYPTLVLFSRTLMSEVPSATLLLAAVVLYLRETRWSRVGAGALLGVVGFFRYANPITAALFICGALLADVHALRSATVPRPRANPRFRLFPRATQLFIGFVPVTLLLVAYDEHTFGNPFGPYGTVGHFGLQYVPNHLGEYALVLAGIWPLMLFAPLLYRGKLRLEALITTFGTLLVMSAWYYAEDTHSTAENIATIPRLLLPAIPLWILTYAAVADRLFRSVRTYRAAALTAMAVGVIAAFGVSVAHQRYLHQAVTIRQFVDRHIAPGSVLVINDETSIFVGRAFGSPRFVREGQSSVRQLRCPSRLPLTVIYTGKGEAGDRESLTLSYRTVNRLRAVPVASRLLDAWSAGVWQRGPC